jgi:rSAM/selenodomain-associated transferase 1
MLSDGDEMPDALVLFAKAPLPGRVKTRLTPLLSAEQAAEFHWACVCDTWDKIEQVPVESRYFYSDNAWTNGNAPGAPEQRGIQRGADLGDRMFNCFQELHARGHRRMLIVGSDSPTLPLTYLEQGLEALDRADAVIGPSEDGGYYAIGCREPYPQMFSGVPWSAGDTLQRTEAGLRALGLKVVLLPAWYDVDTANDLRRLAREATLPANVAHWMTQHGSLLG